VRGLLQHFLYTIKKMISFNAHLKKILFNCSEIKCRFSASNLPSQSNKWSAVSWALRLQRVVLQGLFASWALLYFKVVSLLN